MVRLWCAFAVWLAWRSLGANTYAIPEPCYGCIRNDATKNTTNSECQYPCQCSTNQPISCPEGVHVTKDGCGCCAMCSRQHGEMCDKRFVCDVTKELRCTANGVSVSGVCQAKAPKSCVIKGVLYTDGETFFLGCKRRCTCQNGNYGCVNVCPQESRPPSRYSCNNPKLMHVNGSCCREWSCDLRKTRRMRMLPAKSSSYSQQLCNTRNKTQATGPICKLQKGSWSPCSTTCGVGVSMRLTNENFDCIATVQRRLCYLRPCGVLITTEGRKKCTPTTKTRQPHFITFKDCISIKAKRIKFCTTCKANRCCYPQKSKTVVLKFRCAAGLKQYYSFQWIKKCQCKRTCHHTHVGHAWQP